MSEKRDEQLKPKRCFVITPIGADGSPDRRHADWVLFGAVKPVFESAGYEVFRADTIADPGMINDAIFEHVIDDDVCVADLTFLNANVLYELGVRHALSKPVIHIAATGTPLPFDNAQHRAIFFDRDDYRSFEGLKQHLSAQLATLEGPSFVVSNPLTHARGRQKLRTEADPKDKIITDLIANVESLSKKLDRLTSIRSPSNLNPLLPSGYAQNENYNKISQSELERIFILFKRHIAFTETGNTISADRINYDIQDAIDHAHELDMPILAKMARDAGVPDQQMRNWRLSQYIR